MLTAILKGASLTYTNVDLSFAGSVVVLIILCAAAVWFSFFSYKETIPPVSPLRKHILAVLRSLSMCTVVFIIFEPILSLSYQKNELAVIAVLADHSESMGITDAGGDRRAILTSILSGETLKEIEKNNRVDFFKFSNDAEPVERREFDSLAWDGGATDIASSLETVKKKMAGKNFTAAVLISDGQYNLGTNPAAYASVFGVPIFTIGVGNPAEQKDIVMSQINNNEIAYVNNKIPVDASLTSFGYKGKSLTVHLTNENKVIQTRTVTAQDDGAIVHAAFEIQADKIGLQKYAIGAVPLEGELTEKNNSKTFFIKVLKNKSSVCLVSGAPGSDHGFLYLTLRDDPSIQVKGFVENKDGALSELKSNAEDPAKEFDCFIFNNYPTANSDMSKFQSYANSITRDGKPLLLFYGMNFDVNRFQLLKTASPVEFKTDNALEETQIYPALSVSGKNSVILKISDDPNETARQWAELPPVWIYRTTAVPSDGSEVLARVDMTRASNVLKLRRDIPLIVSKRSVKQKSIAVMAYGLWKSYFVMSGLGKSNSAYTSFISNAVRWLTTTDDTRPVIISTSKKIYHNGEKVLFTAQAYDEQFNPVNDATVKLRIIRGERITDLQMEFVGNGRYEGVLNGLEVGDYDFTGEAVKNDIILGKDNGKFTVEDFSIELVTTAMNEKLLKNIAAESGGRYFTADSVSDILRYINFPPQISEEKDETELWNKSVLLYLFAGLLTVEWFIRKRSGML